MRGGCSCAGTYGHLLLDIPKQLSNIITSKVDAGDLSVKPGWVRLSIHPTMTNQEIDFICEAVVELASNHKKWKNDYQYNSHTNEFYFKGDDCVIDPVGWFEI